MELNEIVKHVEEIDGWFLGEQMGFIYPYVSALKSKSVILEIGTYRGRSTLFLALSSPKDTAIITIDPCNHP